MTSLSHSPRDEALCELANHGGMMKKHELRRQMRSRLPELDLILEELEKEGRIGMSATNIVLLI
jgi:hypothetical protein